MDVLQVTIPLTELPSRAGHCLFALPKFQELKRVPLCLTYAKGRKKLGHMQAKIVSVPDSHVVLQP